MLSPETIWALAERLRQAELSCTPIAPLRNQLLDEQAAYLVQQENVRYAQAQGRRIIGRKIGLTSLAVQKQLGIDQPDVGTLFADMVCGDDQPIPWHRTLQPKVEAEVALVLARDLNQEDTTANHRLRAKSFRCRSDLPAQSPLRCAARIEIQVGCS